MARIVVLGGSFGGLTAAFELKRLLGKKAAVTVVSEDDKFVFIPSLPWLAMGWRQAADISLSLRPILERKGMTFIHEKAKGVDADNSRVVTEAGEETIEAEVTTDARKGQVIVPHCFGLVYDGVKYGANVNRLTKNTNRDFVGTPMHRYVPCRVEAV